MMLRVVSSMNSTRHWVTPPREPILCQILLQYPPSFLLSSRDSVRDWGERTGAAENAGDLDELDGDLGAIHLCSLSQSVVVEIKIEVDSHTYVELGGLRCVENGCREGWMGVQVTWRR
jgi:hypothetical protein